MLVSQHLLFNNKEIGIALNKGRKIFKFNWTRYLLVNMRENGCTIVKKMVILTVERAFFDDLFPLLKKKTLTKNLFHKGDRLIWKKKIFT